MAYAEVGVLLGRAGTLKGAWDDTTSPSLADLEQFLADASAQVDAQLGALGYDTPVVDERAAAALRPLVADLALMVAIEATWPGQAGPTGVRAAYDGARARVYGDDGGLRLATVTSLLATVGGSAGAGASDLWSREGLEGNESREHEELTIGRSMRL